MLISQIEDHTTRVLAKYAPLLSSDHRFTNPARLIDRVRDIFSRMPTDLAELRALHESHNELVVAEALLREPIEQLTYEPLQDSQNKTIDFLVKTERAENVLVDVKTISPEPVNRWDQFERGRSAGWIPDSFDLSAAWMGGDLWHSSFSARARMLEYTVELETKFPRYQAALPAPFAVMAFCSNGFSWQVDELEDFVAYYFTGGHRSDDGFAQMERHSVREKQVHFSRTISRFAYFERPSIDLGARICCWNVQPPEDPAGT